MLRYAESGGARSGGFMKIQAITVHATGEPEVLELEERELAIRARARCDPYRARA